MADDDAADFEEKAFAKTKPKQVPSLAQLTNEQSHKLNS